MTSEQSKMWGKINKHLSSRELYFLSMAVLALEEKWKKDAMQRWIIVKQYGTLGNEICYNMFD